MSNYLFHWPAWVSFRLIPVVILAGFVVSIVAEGARAASKRAAR